MVVFGLTGLLLRTLAQITIFPKRALYRGYIGILIEGLLGRI